MWLRPLSQTATNLPLRVIERRASGKWERVSAIPLAFGTKLLAAPINPCTFSALSRAEPFGRAIAADRVRRLGVTVDTTILQIDARRVDSYHFPPFWALGRSNWASASMSKTFKIVGILSIVSWSRRLGRVRGACTRPRIRCPTSIAWRWPRREWTARRPRSIRGPGHGTGQRSEPMPAAGRRCSRQTQINAWFAPRTEDELSRVVAGRLTRAANFDSTARGDGGVPL